MRDGFGAGSCAAVALAGLALAACGSGDGAGTKAATRPPTTTGPDPCTLLKRADLATVFGGSPPTGKRTASTCFYTRITPASADGTRPRRAISLSADLRDTTLSTTPTLDGNQRVSLGNGVRANARVTSQGSATAGPQAQIAFVMRHRQMGFLLSDSARRTGSPVDPVVRLARRVARRLSR